MTQVEVRGRATPEELAALLTVLTGARSAEPAPDRYTRWRRIRLAALRTTAM